MQHLEWVSEHAEDCAETLPLNSKKVTSEIYFHFSRS